MMTCCTYRQTADVGRRRCGLDVECAMAWLVLLTIALSVVSSGAGQADVEGKIKNGIRRAASQLERKFSGDRRCALGRFGQDSLSAAGGTCQLAVAPKGHVRTSQQFGLVGQGAFVLQ